MANKPVAIKVPFRVKRFARDWAEKERKKMTMKDVARGQEDIYHLSDELSR